MMKLDRRWMRHTHYSDLMDLDSSSANFMQ